MRKLLLPLLLLSTLGLSGCAFMDFMRGAPPAATIERVERSVAEGKELYAELVQAGLLKDAEEVKLAIAEGEKFLEDSKGRPWWSIILNGILIATSTLAGGKVALVAGTLRRVVAGVEEFRDSTDPQVKDDLTALLTKHQLGRDAATITKIKAALNI